MAKKITPLVSTTTKHVLTPSILEQQETVSNQEFSENFEQGQFHPVSQGTSGKGNVTIVPTYYDRRDGMRGSFLVEETK